MFAGPATKIQIWTHDEVLKDVRKKPIAQTTADQLCAAIENNI